MKKLIAFCLLISAIVARAQENGADSVLREMEQTYAAARSYSDTSTADFRNPDGKAGAHVDFKIWFARPKFFRIDATTSAPDATPLREVMWFDGEMARMWSSNSAVLTRSKIQLAGSKMFGTYAYHIPTLLDASYAGPQRLNQLSSAELLANETIDGVECAYLRGQWLHDAYEVWLGKEDRLVRKIVANYSGYVMEENHREIKVNEPIDPAVFHFAPENEAGPATKKATPPPLPGEHRRP